ncbi:MAG: ABC-F family ATP-binding cassette domain-containing protein [Candidatus Nanopelagicales bacterium]
MIAVHDLEIRIGARLLMSGVTFRVAEGDKVGLVGRNGAGKTTLTKVLTESLPATAGDIQVTGRVGYLPQDPRTGDISNTGINRILSARNIDKYFERMQSAQNRMADSTTFERASREYEKAETQFLLAGGYAAQSEANSIALSLGLTLKALSQPLQTLSGGQRRRVELARILFSGADTLILDEPTNHLDTDSIVWLTNFIVNYPGAVIVITHDIALLEKTVNRVLFLDAIRCTIDVYNLGWKQYLEQREQDERRRKRERMNAENKAQTLIDQANRFRAKASKARTAQSMLKRADILMESTEGEAQKEKKVKIKFPTPEPCGKVPLSGHGLTRAYGSDEVFASVDLAIDRGSRIVVLGLNGAGKTTLLRLLANIDIPDRGEVMLGHGAKVGYYAQEHETLDLNASVLQNLLKQSPHLTEQQGRTLLGSFLFTNDDVFKPAGVLSGGEKTRLALAILVVSGANVLLLDEPTNNLDPASRQEILRAIAEYEGAIVLVTHDFGAVEALEPERVLLLPDGVEDFWNQDYQDLISLA